MNFFKKIKLLYLPFLLISFCMWVLYNFLNWLFIIHLEVISIKDIIVNFGLPLALPWIPILFYLKPKLKLLKLTTKGGYNWLGFYVVVPIYNNAVDTANVVSWLGLKYSRTIKNNLEDKEKKDAYHAFEDKCQKNLMM